jgi:DNA processing protein
VQPSSVNTDDRLRSWLALARVPGLGPRTVARLIDHFGEPSRVLMAAPQELAAAGVRASVIQRMAAGDEAAIDADLRWMEQHGAHILTLEDPRYPPLLRDLPDAPTLLYVRGDPSVLTDPQISIVGSRNPTFGGRETTLEFARHLAACGLTVTSGLALGVDGAAHEGALEVGRSVAVLGTGPDRVYPAAHRDLARRIAGQGAVVTELPPGTPARGSNFPRRNRIISGLSLGTLVTEAALASGSLITARCAMEQGRDVFAIPGSIHNPIARGCHALIRSGAKLVETAQDILEELAPLLRSFVSEAPEAADATPKANAAAKLDAEYERLLVAMGHDPVATDEVIRRVGLPADAVASMLLLLELEGYVSSYPGGRYCRAKGPAGAS